MPTKTELTPERLAELVEVYEETKRGKWQRFIEAAHNAIPALLETLAEKEAELRELTEHDLQGINDPNKEAACRRCGITVLDDHDGYDCIGFLKRRNEEISVELQQTNERIAELETILRVRAAVIDATEGQG